MAQTGENFWEEFVITIQLDYIDRINTARKVWRFYHTRVNLLHLIYHSVWYEPETKVQTYIWEQEFCGTTEWNGIPGVLVFNKSLGAKYRYLWEVLEYIKLLNIPIRYGSNVIEGLWSA